MKALKKTTVWSVSVCKNLNRVKHTQRLDYLCCEHFSYSGC